MPRLAVIAAAAALTLNALLVLAIDVSQAPGNDLEPCATQELAPWSAESNDCAAKSSYDWHSKFMPTNVQRKALCACTSLIHKLETVTLPYCGLYRENNETGAGTGGGFYEYSYVVRYAFELCNSSTTTTTPTKTTAPTTTTATPTNSTASPYVVSTNAPDTSSPSTAVTNQPSSDLDTSTSSPTKTPKSNTGTIVGVVIAVVVVGAMAAFVIYTPKEKHATSPGDKNHQDAGAVNNNGALETLSPMGGDGGNDATYTSMPVSPMGPAAKGRGVNG